MGSEGGCLGRCGALITAVMAISASTSAPAAAAYQGPRAAITRVRSPPRVSLQGSASRRRLTVTGTGARGCAPDGVNGAVGARAGEKGVVGERVLSPSGFDVGA